MFLETILNRNNRLIVLLRNFTLLHYPFFALDKHKSLMISINFSFLFFLFLFFTICWYQLPSFFLFCFYFLLIVDTIHTNLFFFFLVTLSDNFIPNSIFSFSYTLSNFFLTNFFLIIPPLMLLHWILSFPTLMCFTTVFKNTKHSTQQLR